MAMRDKDWIDKYPQVKALLQQEGDALEYTMDDEATVGGEEDARRTTLRGDTIAGEHDFVLQRVDMTPDEQDVVALQVLDREVVARLREFRHGMEAINRRYEAWIREALMVDASFLGPRRSPSP